MSARQVTQSLRFLVCRSFVAEAASADTNYLRFEPRFPIGFLDAPPR